MARIIAGVPWLSLAVLGAGVAALSVSELSANLPGGPGPFPERCFEGDPNDDSNVPSPRSAVSFPKMGFKIHEAGSVGATSCSAAACHGGDSGTYGGEYGTWVSSDPHRKAFQVLYNDVSRQIARNLESSRGGKHIDAHEDALCLKCHGTAVQSVGNEKHDAFNRRTIERLGVGCEACHGPAEHYLSRHYQSDFLALDSAQKAEQFGLFPTKDLAFRAMLCASCHVGDGSREVNHDLIAAGHPRLNFEFSSYHQHPKYGKHWKEKKAGIDFELRGWAIGQVASARQAIDLLHTRATQADAKRSPWPEFAEYSCYACHKNLDPARESWKDVNAPSERAAGALPWGTWTMPVLSAVPERSDKLFDPKDGALVKLRQLMESPQPDPKKIADLCVTIRSELDAWAARLQIAKEFDAASVTRLFRAVTDNALTADGVKFNNLEWDGAAQHYISLKAIERAHGSRPASWSETLEELRKLLLFPNDFNSPRDEKPSAILKQFQDLRRQAHDMEKQP